MTYDDLDERIIDVLLADGRASLRSIAEELGVAVTTVSNYLGELEDDAVVRGYVPRIDYGKLGYDVTAILRLRVRGDSLPGIAERLAEHDHLIGVYEVTGRYDVVAIGKFADTDEMNDGIEALLAMPEVLEADSSVGLSIPFEFRQFALDASDE